MKVLLLGIPSSRYQVGTQNYLDLVLNLHGLVSFRKEMTQPRARVMLSSKEETYT